MTDWSFLDRDWQPDWPPFDPYVFGTNSYYPEKPPVPPCVPPQAQQYIPPPSPTLTLMLSAPQESAPPPAPRAPVCNEYAAAPRGENPREIRNKAEKQRRDKLNTSIAELASMVPPVVAANRKIDKTGVLRLTAHYLRAHQYVFGDSIEQAGPGFSLGSADALLGLLRGFLLTTTYRGLIVVVSPNVQQYLGYAELDLLGHNIFNITHPDDQRLLREQLMPKSALLGAHGELLVPEGPDGMQKVAEALAREKRSFVVRFKKISQRTEPAQYVTCHVEGSLRKSDRACRGYNRCCQMVRRARARGDNPCASGNDVVFVGMVRPTTETFRTESSMESFRMEYRTRHSIDGEIIQCEQRIALVTGYMTHEVNGVNAMNFMHRDDVRWVIVALRQMYDQHRVFGESCYRLMTKNGQFIYMRTRGQLDVDEESRAVRSFVCINTVVEEQEGKHLIKQMKKKFHRMINSNFTHPQVEIKEVTEDLEEALPVEDPRQLEKVILHLVTDLPSPLTEETPDRGDSPCLPLAIIPPKKERIVSAIEKIYSVIKHFKVMNNEKENPQNDPAEPTVPAIAEVEPELAQSSSVDLSAQANVPPDIRADHICPDIYTRRHHARPYSSTHHAVPASFHAALSLSEGYNNNNPDEPERYPCEFSRSTPQPGPSGTKRRFQEDDDYDTPGPSDSTRMKTHQEYEFEPLSCYMDGEVQSAAVDFKRVELDPAFPELQMTAEELCAIEEIDIEVPGEYADSESKQE